MSLKNRTTMEQMHRLIDAQPSPDDETLCAAYDKLMTNLNAEGQAQGFYAALARICSQRPHLVERLLRQPLDCDVCMGVDQAEQSLGYVRHHLNEKSWMAQQAGPEGRAWLAEELPKHKELMQRIIGEQIEYNARDD